MYEYKWCIILKHVSDKMVKNNAFVLLYVRFYYCIHWMLLPTKPWDHSSILQRDLSILFCEVRDLAQSAYIWLFFTPVLISICVIMHNMWYMCIAINSEWHPNAHLQCKEIHLPLSAPQCTDSQDPSLKISQCQLGSCKSAEITWPIA